MKKIIVIGGGFAGSICAKKLEKNFDVTLIDTKDYFEFTPGVLRVLVEPEHFERIQVKHSQYLKKTKVVVGCVSEVGKDYLKLKDRNGKINFDYLVIASGSSYSLPIKESGVYYPSRVKHLKDFYEHLKKASKVYVIGGGLVGTELMAEISTHYKDKELFIIHAHERLIERNSKKSSEYAQAFLEKRGVKIVFNERIAGVKRGKLTAPSGRVFDIDEGVVFFTTGIKPNLEFMKKKFKQFCNKGVNVNEYLQLSNIKNIFVAGDVSGVREEKTAQNSNKHGVLVARNIKALEKGRKMKKYKAAKRLMVISLGKFNGIIEYKKFMVGGIIPALVKALIEKMIMFKHGRLF